MPPRRPLVLVADDHPVQRHLHVQVLRHAGLRVQTVSNGVRAFAKARDLSPDLIILSYRLAAIDGPTLCWLIKHHPQTSSIPTIIVTSDVFEAHVVNARKVGCDSVVSEPCPPVEFLATAMQLIDARRKPGRAQRTRIVAKATLRSGIITIRREAPRVRRRHR